MPDATPLAPPDVRPAALDAFLDRWRGAQGGERAEAQLFLAELCDLLGVERPGGLGNEEAYAFERPVRFHDGPQQTTGFIDLYRRGAFVLETKQGVDEDRAAQGRRRRTGHGTRGSAAWEDTMTAAKNQAARYARNLEPGGPIYSAI